jgi:hypothetical protein
VTVDVIQMIARGFVIEVVEERPLHLVEEERRRVLIETMMMMTMLTMMMTLLMVGGDDKYHDAYDYNDYKELLITIIIHTSDKNTGHGGANYEDDFDDNDNDGGESPGDFINENSSVKY